MLELAETMGLFARLTPLDFASGRTRSIPRSILIGDLGKKVAVKQIEMGFVCALTSEIMTSLDKSIFVG